MALSFDLTKFYFNNDFTVSAQFNSSGDYDVVILEPSKKEKIFGTMGTVPGAELTILAKAADFTSAPVEDQKWVVNGETWRAVNVRRDSKGTTYRIGLVGEYE